MTETSLVTLRAGDFEAIIAPEIGGSLAALTYKGSDVLRHASAKAVSDQDPYGMACYPMLPYANRIKDGRFEWGGVSYAVPPNASPHPHPMHGVGWQSKWTVMWTEATRIGLLMEHDGSEAWPFAFAAGLAYELTPDGLTITLGLTNLSDIDAPVTFGFHPYFPSDAARITAVTSGFWEAATDCIPTRHVPKADVNGTVTTGVAVDTLRLDHCLTGWDGAALIEHSGLAVRMEADEAFSMLHLYTPEGRGYFCAEPVSAMPDALNRGVDDNPGTLRLAADGGALATAIRFSIA
jgi:aldose 1-epimerase